MTLDHLEAAPTSSPVGLSPLTRRESRQFELLAAKRLPKRLYVRRLTSKLTAIGAVVGVASLIVSSSVPAAAFYKTVPSAAVAHTSPTNPQSFVAENAVAVSASGSLDRDGYSVTLPPPPKAKSARSFAPAGGFLYTNNPAGTIQWPFPSYVPIASGFGPRIAPCGSCSSFHDGVDFLPGGGAAIGAIAPGVVSAVAADRGGYGTHVVVDHVVNGQNVQSTYAHMIAGSPTVTVGQTVTVAQTLGLVGNTGASTGAHLHLGISIKGTFVDPFAWLKANAN